MITHVMIGAVGAVHKYVPGERTIPFGQRTECASDRNIGQSGSNWLIKVWCGNKRGMLKTRGCVSGAECQNNKVVVDYKKTKTKTQSNDRTHQKADEENAGGCRKPT